MNASAQDLKHDIGEMWLAQRCEDFGAVMYGVTDATIRRERIRASIIEQCLESAICGKGAKGKPETFGAAYLRLYGQPVTP